MEVILNIRFEILLITFYIVWTIVCCGS